MGMKLVSHCGLTSTSLMIHDVLYRLMCLPVTCILFGEIPIQVPLLILKNYCDIIDI